MRGTDAGCARAAGRVAAVPPPSFGGSPDGLLRYFRHVLRAVRLPRQNGVLEQHHGRIPEAARTLGIQRTNLYRKTKQLKVHPVTSRRPS
jgi:DNA-binding NtrC family response regulator